MDGMAFHLEWRIKNVGMSGQQSTHGLSMLSAMQYTLLQRMARH